MYAPTRIRSDQIRSDQITLLRHALCGQLDLAASIFEYDIGRPTLCRQLDLAVTIYIYVRIILVDLLPVVIMRVRDTCLL